MPDERTEKAVFALALAGIAVLFARFVLALEPGQQFLAAYPGEYPLPEGAPVGLPVWLNWSHFLNSFFLLFIIRSGWQVRREKRPAAFWSPRGNKKRRISLALWFHQAIDILWIANGVLFVVLLFVTGQWMRVIPTVFSAPSCWKVSLPPTASGRSYCEI